MVVNKARVVSKTKKVKKTKKTKKPRKSRRSRPMEQKIEKQEVLAQNQKHPPR